MFVFFFFLFFFFLFFSNILETPSYFVLPPWYIRRQKIVLDLMHLKKDRTDASIYDKLFMKIRQLPSLYSCLYRGFTWWEFSGLWYSFPIEHHNLTDSASIFTAEIWATIKALEENNSIASKYIVFTDSLLCCQALQSMKLEHPLIGMVIRKCLFLKFDNKNIIFCWVPSHTGTGGNEKADSGFNAALLLFVFYYYSVLSFQRPWYVLSCLWDDAYKRTLAVNR